MNHPTHQLKPTLPKLFAREAPEGATAVADDPSDPRDLTGAGAAPADPLALAEDERLLIWLGDAPYLVRLPDLREVLFSAPQAIALPFSPPWLWGVFPLRTELAPLADPLPMLRGGPEGALAPTALAGAPLAEPQAIIVGEGERLVALLVQRIGDIRSLGPSDLTPLDEATLPTGAPLLRYLLGGVVAPDLERVALALDVTQLADDLLAALEERAEHE